MKKTTIAAYAIFAIFATMFSSCDKNLTLSKEIQNIVHESTLAKITDLGMPIHKGNSPANLVNFYKVSPFILKA